MITPLGQTIGLGSESYVTLEEAVEESDIIESQTQRDLLDLQIGDLELTLGVGDDGFDDDIAGRSFSYRFDGRTQMRQG